MLLHDNAADYKDKNICISIDCYANIFSALRNSFSSLSYLQT